MVSMEVVSDDTQLTFPSEPYFRTYKFNVGLPKEFNEHISFKFEMCKHNNDSNSNFS